MFETKIIHGSPPQVIPPRHHKTKIPLPSKFIETKIIEDDVQFLPTPAYENLPTPSTLLYLRPTYKPNPEPFIPSQKLIDLDNLKRL